MSEIKATDVARLRKTTGSGMMDCKKALVETRGNFDKAIEVLRKKGQKIAAKRIDRETLEGAAIAKVNLDNTVGVSILLGCETDFVGKNVSFIELANKLAEQALLYSNKEDFLNSDFGGITVAEKLIEQTGVIGEKIELNNFKKIESAYVGHYVHVGNKIASLVGLSDRIDGIEVIAKDVAMQIASMGATVLSYKNFDPEFVNSETEVRISVIKKENIELERLGKPLKKVPKYISSSQLTEEVLATTKEAIKEELKAEGKPEKIWDKILPGKMERFILDNTTLDQEQCLLQQKFIKDEKRTVDEYVKTLGDISITNFARISLG